MKINAGEFKYRNIEIPEGIRPTTEKVREAVFSMISDRIYGAVVLDLFAGSGGMGLEALSRGAAKCYFNEWNNRNARIVQKNIATCRAEDRSAVMNRDFRRAIRELPEQVDIVIIDPPYQAGYYDDVFDLLQEYDSVRDGGILVVEHIYDNNLSDTIGKYEKIKQKKYGTIGVDIYRCVSSIAKNTLL
ncbi:MAG: 16S rRNA (guanine(966)-N(2))-methyltransferase RsmD [Mogibacterium sp.]|nr:16S rRNA (guanine(966)-N(2))-methyltransferase RsmD [Mogibacterium sp.]